MSDATTPKPSASAPLEPSNGLHPALTLALVVGGLALYPFIFGQYMNFGVSMLLFAGFAMAWDILGGWTGQNSLGNAVFVGIGAYTVAIFAEWGIAPWWAAFAPAATPSAVVAKLEGWFNRIATAPENRDPLVALGVEPLPGSSERTKAMLAESMKSWEQITRLTKIEAQ